MSWVISPVATSDKAETRSIKMAVIVKCPLLILFYASVYTGCLKKGYRL
jgi:hypothetical protein